MTRLLNPKSSEIKHFVFVFATIFSLTPTSWDHHTSYSTFVFSPAVEGYIIGFQPYWEVAELRSSFDGESPYPGSPV